MTGRLAKRYARALFQLAREESMLEGVGAELGRATSAFANPRLRAVLSSPVLQASERLHLCSQVVDALAVSRTVANLLRLMAQRDRLALLGDVGRAYERLLDEEVGRLRIGVRSAVELGAAEVEQVLALARQLTKQQNIIANVIVDPGLIGGVLIDIKGTVYDGTVKTRLERLAQEMATQQ